MAPVAVVSTAQCVDQLRSTREYVLAQVVQRRLDQTGRTLIFCVAMLIVLTPSITVEVGVQSVCHDVAGECESGATIEAEFVEEEGHDSVAFVVMQQSLDQLQFKGVYLIMRTIHNINSISISIYNTIQYNTIHNQYIIQSYFIMM